MTTPEIQTPNLPPPQDQEPFIPPFWLLIVAIVGFVIAFIVLVTQPTFTVVGWGGLGLGLLGLIAWALMSPEQARNLLTGKTARYGGTSVIVTVVFLAALVVIYILIRNQNIRADLTQTNDFSLTAEARAAFSTLAADPSIPSVRMLAFYGQQQAGRRDQDTLLLEDYQTTSNGKITYEFIDPERSPQLLEQYGVTTPGQIVVAPLNADGTVNTERAELVRLFSQEELSNAALRVMATGNFRALFLNTEGGLSTESTEGDGLSLLKASLEDLNWTVQDVSIFDISAEQPTVNLQDPAFDGTVLVVAGGEAVLSDENLAVITNFVSAGGDLVLMAAPGFTSVPGEGDAEATATATTTLAAAPNMSEFLFQNFGLRFRSDIILDLSAQAGDAFSPIALPGTGSFVVDDLAADNPLLVFRFAHSIEQAETLPTGVSVVTLAQTAETAYSKSDLGALLADPANTAAQVETDAVGPFTVAASAENSSTGGRVILIGSDWLATNNSLAALAGTNAVNGEFMTRSLQWAAGADAFAGQVPITTSFRPQDTPVFATEDVVRNINLITVFVIPFGVLIIGVLVWWLNREVRPAVKEKVSV
ncbi:MAG TPA: Gldg family protein [Aggregatilineales bacterium]|nr:Gldg family protein [Aggregatilineales bacterium]